MRPQGCHATRGCVAFCGRRRYALRAVQAASAKRGVTLRYLDVPRVGDLENSFRAATEAGAEAILMLSSPIFLRAQKEIVALAARHRLPAIYDKREYVENGGLMSYGADVAALARRPTSACRLW